jgi:hypothetical protein
MGKNLLHNIGSRHFILLYLGGPSLLTRTPKSTQLFPGGIITSLTSMSYSYFIKHQDRPAHGASGMSNVLFYPPF